MLRLFAFLVCLSCARGAPPGLGPGPSPGRDTMWGPTRLHGAGALGAKAGGDGGQRDVYGVFTGREPGSALPVVVLVSPHRVLPDPKATATATAPRPPRAPRPHIRPPATARPRTPPPPLRPRRRRPVPSHTTATPPEPLSAPDHLPSQSAAIPTLVRITRHRYVIE